jgi:hypothetical protein
MRRWLMVSLLSLAVAGAAAGETFENKKIGIAVEAPAGFVVTQQKADNSPLGEILGAYEAPDVANTASRMVVHLMEVPGGMDFDAFKKGAVDLLKAIFGEMFKLVKQDEPQVEKLTGFMLDFELPGNGTNPAPDGKIKHHARWYFFKQPDGKMAGILYTSQEAAWKDVEPKVTASAKTLKHVE